MNDELILLWQQGVSKEPDAAEVARLAGRATVTRFDWVIKRRNFIEYLAGVYILIVYGRQIAMGKGLVQPLLAIAGVLFVMGYLWRSHRNLPQLDPTADARAYQAVMLARVDRQIRLLSTVRYWYILPLYIPMVVQVADLWSRGPAKAIGGFVAGTTLCAGVIWLNERFAVRRLKAKREKIEALYKEEQ